MSKINLNKIADFVMGKDIEARHEELVKQVNSLRSIYDEEINNLRDENEILREALKHVIPNQSLDEEESTLIPNQILNDLRDAYFGKSRRDDDDDENESEK